MNYVILGRPNVGKSTLFNALVGRQQAITSNVAGTTRDERRGEVRGALDITVVDTPGVDALFGSFPIEKDQKALEAQLKIRLELAIQAADGFLLVVDGTNGIQPQDKQIADLIRKTDKPVIVAVNRLDSAKCDPHVGRELGFTEVIAISALRKTGIRELLKKMMIMQSAATTNILASQSPPASNDVVRPPSSVIRPLVLALVGRPNTGKSTLFNALFGRARAITSPVPGTTRDAVDETFMLTDGEKQRLVTIIDTAGFRRRAQIARGVESWSVAQAEEAITRADLALLVLDAAEGATRGDMRVAAFAASRHKPLWLILNKWDLLIPHKKTASSLLAARLLRFPQFQRLPRFFVSALTGAGLSNLVAALVAQPKDAGALPIQNLKAAKSRPKRGRRH